MRSMRRVRRVTRTSRFEWIEPRLVMSGTPAGQLSLEYFVEDQRFDEVQPALADAHDLTGLSEALREYGLTGKGQTVVVIDTGVAYDHVALGGGLGPEYQVVGGFDFTGQRDLDPYDDGPYGGHGTHVAGIIASNAPANPGVAPGVDLIALRVFDDEGLGTFDWIEEALAWVHDNRNAFDNPITTVNLSIGSQYNSDAAPLWSTIEDDLALLEDDGIFISVAAGNGFSTYQEPGLSYPAASPYVVPVASVDGDGQLSYYSQRNDRVIAAPGRGILSTVPDYIGNGNGIDDDFASFSGTSMAAPYVAGASVLLREAYAFAGLDRVTQDTIYDVMRSTADLVYDAATGQSYYRLNLDRALDEIMPADDFGSQAYAAYDLGNLADASAISGTIGTLQDLDFFTFTAAQTGQMTLSVSATRDLVPQWELVGGGQLAETAEGVFTLDVGAGQSYTLALGSADGIGHYTIDVRLEAAFSSPGTDGGWQQVLSGTQVSAQGQWLAFTAGRQGLVTVEAFFANADGDVDLQLFDAQQRLLGGSYGTGDSERIDVTVAAGDTFYVYAYRSGSGGSQDVDLRVTNLVAQDGRAISVEGTAGDDRFTFTAGDQPQVTINGVSYTFDAAAVQSVTFDGRDGTDTAVFFGTSGNDEAVLRVGSAELTGPGYAVSAVDVEDVTVYGGGGTDTAFLYDSAGDDEFVAAEDDAQLTGPGFSSRAVDFPYVHAYATAGGFDVAFLYGSAGDDIYSATPTFGRLYGDGFVRRAKYFEVVHGYATAGGHDVARLFGSAGNDVFDSGPAYAKMYGDGFYNRARFFEEVHADAGSGGYDYARLFGSVLDDRLRASDSEAQLSNPVQATWIDAFDYLDVYAVSGGTDRAEIAAVDYLLRLLGDWR